MARPRISLIIPAYNEERYIGRTLYSIARARARYRNPALIEVVVVNNGSTDNTERIARELGATVTLEENRCIASARNKGAATAAGEIVGFLDTDCLITPNMFNSIDEAMNSGESIGGGTMIKLDRSSPGLFCTYCITVVPARWLFGIAGGLLFTTKKTFDDLGGFDESLYCAEDTKFALELKKYGRKTGKRFSIISRDYVITSARAFDRFGDWYYFKNIPRIISKRGTRAFRDRNFCRGFWYDVER